MKSANPYVHLPGNTEEAFRFYRSVFGGDFVGITRYGDFPDNPMGVPDGQLNRIANMGLPIGDSVLMGTDIVDGMGPVELGNSHHILVEAEDPDEAERVFGKLSAGGQTDMPLQETEWAEKYGICNDQFGVRWMVMYTGAVTFSHGE